MIEFFHYVYQTATDNAKFFSILLSISVVASIYLLQILRNYVRILKLVEENNRKEGKLLGLCVVHEFTYSWRRGVTLRPIHFGSKEQKCGVKEKESEGEV